MTSEVTSSPGIASAAGSEASIASGLGVPFGLDGVADALEPAPSEASADGEDDVDSVSEASPEASSLRLGDPGAADGGEDSEGSAAAGDEPTGSE
ncbi:hypothetical protein GCM10020260_15010 [Nesterenkonia halobia]|uniref:Uncharacterized protein n=1 Tax=Nesterenkonia halobia TaxID=37922 RepID=A0ABP6RDZ1_9MICC